MSTGADQRKRRKKGNGAIISAVASFFILAGAYLPNFSTENMGPKSMFLAILTGLGASALYLRFYRLFNKRKVLLFSTGADRDFNKMLTNEDDSVTEFTYLFKLS